LGQNSKANFARGVVRYTLQCEGCLVGDWVTVIKFNGQISAVHFKSLIWSQFY